MNEEMIPALIQYPYEDESGRIWNDLICHYAYEGMSVICAQTGEIYDKAIDKYPCKYTYYMYQEPDPEPEPEPDQEIEE